MNDNVDPLGAGDASDLAWLDLRADETARHYYELRAELEAQNEVLQAAQADGTASQGMRDEWLVRFESVNTAQTAALEAKKARDDAYTAQEALLPPPAEPAMSVEERAEWIGRLRADAADALIRLDAAQSELAEMHIDPAPDYSALTDEELSAALDAALPVTERRIALINDGEQAEKDLKAAVAALHRAGALDE